MNDMSLDKIISQKIGDLTIQNAKLAVLVEVLKLEIAKRDAEIAKMKGAEPELPIGRPAMSNLPSNKYEDANGKSH